MAVDPGEVEYQDLMDRTVALATKLEALIDDVFDYSDFTATFDDMRGTRLTVHHLVGSLAGEIINAKRYYDRRKEKEAK